MDSKTIFTVDIYEKYNFLNDKEIDKVINSIDKHDLMEYEFFKGNAKSTYGALPNQQPYILDYHKDIEDKIINELYIKNQRLADSWCNIQSIDSTLTYHNHPNSIISGIIFLKADENSSKLVFKNPVLRTQNDTYEITPKTGMMVLWPSYLMHGSGDSINKSSERIVLSFNTFFK
jgi:uncharacterized protein (TIGR02466 family)